ncbi:hypothetical protein TrRE_jg13339, partial [Triparma retinervis]
MTPFIPDANLELTEVDLTSILKSATRSKLFYACVFNLVSALILVVYNTVVKNVTNRVHGEDRDNCANVILGWVTFKADPLRLGYCVYAEIITTYLEVLKGWIMHNSHMRTYSCRLRVSSIVSTLASLGGEETEEGTRGHLEIERIQNTAASANDASDALAVWIDVVSLWVRMGFYIMIWGDLGF